MADLRLDGLCKGWDFPVLDRISLEIAEGEFFVIIGPSGAGKTTLLRMVAGLESPDAGKVLMGGEDVTSIPPYLRGAAMTFESYALYPQLTVFENIASPLRARKLPEDQIKRTVGKVAELLRIPELLGRKPGEISGGQKQRTALGRTLVATPKVFLLDEPLSHLDAKIRIDLREQFHTLEELRSAATLYVTHDYAEALSLGDRVAVLSEGKIQQTGTPAEIFEQPNSIAVAEQFGQPGINLIDVSLVQDGEQLVAKSGQLDFPVSPSQHDKFQGDDKQLRMGIRPQHLKVSSDGQGYEARVVSFQSLGSYGVLSVDCQGVGMQLIAEPETSLKAGEAVRVDINSEKLIWFDRSGRSVTQAS